MSEKPKPCYREVNGAYFTRNDHRHDCDDTECRGCSPCAGRHCSARKSCTWHVEETELTCGRCISVVRTDLRWIESLAALMLTQAIADGIESEAASLAGPAADPEAWTWHKEAAKQGRVWHVSLTEEDDEHHPLTVLGTWERKIREDYNHDAPADRATIAGAAGYLDRNLHRIAQDDAQDFDLMRSELRRCRQHLEAVLHNDTKPDQGAPCPKCREAGAVVRLKRQYAHWCEDEDCRQIHFTDDGSDTWHCPRDVTHWWTQQGYADEVMEGRAS